MAMNAVFKARTFIEKIILGVCAVLMFTISFLILLQVLMRTLRIGVNWTEEIARFSFVAVTFLGSVLAITRGYHIAITFLADMLPPFARRILDVFIHLVMAAFMGVCIYGSVLLMTAAKGVRSNTLTWFHMNYLYGLVLVSCILMVAACLLRLVELVAKRPDNTGETKGE